MGLDSILNISVTESTAAITRAGFGIPLIVGYHNEYADLVRTYTSPAGVADDFETTDPIYLAAQAIFRQNPRPPRIMVGRRQGAPTWAKKITPKNTTEGFVYRIVNNTGAETATYTVVADDTVALIADNLVTQLNALAGAFTAVDGTTHVTVTANAAGTWFDLDLDPRAFDVEDVSVSPTPALADDLDDLLEASNEWYALILISQKKAELLAAAAWAETNKRIFIPLTSDTDILTSSTTDVASEVKADNYARSGVMYHHRPGQFAQASWFGVMLPKDPGTATFAHKVLAGVTASPLTENQIANLEAKNASYYAVLGAGVAATWEGKTGVGKFLDNVQSMDWTRARVQERIFSRMLSVDKIPFTEGGAAMIKSEILAVLKEGERKLVFVADTSFATTPVIADIPAEVKATRRLPEVQFGAQGAGAIHGLDAYGTISL